MKHSINTLYNLTNYRNKLLSWRHVAKPEHHRLHSILLKFPILHMVIVMATKSLMTYGANAWALIALTQPARNISASAPERLIWNMPLLWFKFQCYRLANIKSNHITNVNIQLPLNEMYHIVLRFLMFDDVYTWTGLIPGLCPANEKRRYFVTTSLIG